jgi:hypothetical protein
VSLDYGINNGDHTYQHRTESAVAFVEFLSSERPHTNLSKMQERAASGKGVYGVKVMDFARPSGQQLLSDEQAGLELLDYAQNASSFTPPFPFSNRSVAIFLLDVRSNKTPWNKHWKQKYRVNYTADFLGADQWDWLEQGLQRSTAAMNIIVSGLQVHADRYYNGNSVEDWSRFPMAQHRLYQAILQSSSSTEGAASTDYQGKPVVLVSGDVHMAELLRRDCRRTKDDDNNNTRMLLEVSTQQPPVMLRAVASGFMSLTDIYTFPCSFR